MVHHLHAKDYGSSLIAAGFASLGQKSHGYLAGDVGIVQPTKGQKDGHMAMYNGAIWVSDFKQHYGLYPGESYRSQRPRYTIYRYQIGDGKPG